VEYLQKPEAALKSKGENKYLKPNCTGKSTNSVIAQKITAELY
jgi:hypothetical protein